MQPHKPERWMDGDSANCYQQNKLNCKQGHAQTYALKYQDCGCPIEYPCKGAHPTLHRDRNGNIISKLSYVRSIVPKEQREKEHHGKMFHELIGIAKEIATDSKCNLVTSERRLKLYQVLNELGAFNGGCKK